LYKPHAFSFSYAIFCLSLILFYVLVILPSISPFDVLKLKTPYQQLALAVIVTRFDERRQQGVCCPNLATFYAVLSNECCACNFFD